MVLPYEDGAGPKSEELDFSTDVQSLDVFFSVDTTSSMDDEIDELSTSLLTTVIPGIRDAVDDTHFGVGSVQDFPISPWGGFNDQPFELLQSVTGNNASVQSGVEGLTLGWGDDYPESNIEGLYQIATGAGLDGPIPPAWRRTMMV